MNKDNGWRVLDPEINELFYRYFSIKKSNDAMKNPDRTKELKLHKQIMDTGLVLDKFLHYMYEAYKDRIK